jgi:hypothetical protein
MINKFDSPAIVKCSLSEPQLSGSCGSVASVYILCRTIAKSVLEIGMPRVQNGLTMKR